MDFGERYGNRALGIGEIPYFDRQSQSKAEALDQATSKAPKETSTNATNGANDHCVNHGGCSHQGQMRSEDHGMMTHEDTARLSHDG